MTNVLTSFSVFRYTSRIKVVWEIFVVVTVLASTLFTAFHIIFGVFQFDLIYWLITVVYILDILYRFNLSVKKGLIVHETRRAIARNYLRGWFTIDLIAAIPFPFIISGLLGGAPGSEIGAAVLASFSALRLVKILTVNRAFRDIRETLDINPSLMRLLSFVFWFVTFVQLMAAGWCLIGASEASRSPIDQYLRAMYWCLTTIATIGYGDYFPNHDSNLQIVYTMIVQIFGVGMYGYIIGNVSSLIANLDVSRANYHKKMEEIGEFLRAKRIPPELQERVRNYYEYLWQTRKSISSVSLTEDLPHTLAMEIYLFLNRSIIEKVELFHNANEIFVREIVQLLHGIVFLPGDDIIEQGEYGDCMYFLSNGDVEVLVNGTRVAVLGQGSPFGETALIQGEKRMATIRALSYCDVYKLDKKNFDELRSKYPEFDAEVKKVVQERLKDTAAKTKGEDVTKS
jgi:voltage-gated potassium channel